MLEDKIVIDLEDGTRIVFDRTTPTHAARLETDFTGSIRVVYCAQEDEEEDYVSCILTPGSFKRAFVCG